MDIQEITYHQSTHDSQSPPSLLELPYSKKYVWEGRDLPFYPTPPIFGRTKGDFIFDPELDSPPSAKHAVGWCTWAHTWYPCLWVLGQETPPQGRWGSHSPEEEISSLGQIQVSRPKGPRPNFVATLNRIAEGPWLLILDFWMGLEVLRFWSSNPRMPPQGEPGDIKQRLLRKKWIAGEFFPPGCPDHLWHLFQLGIFLWEEVSPLTFMITWFPPTMEHKRDIWVKNRRARKNAAIEFENRLDHEHFDRRWDSDLIDSGEKFHFLTVFHLEHIWMQEFPNHPFWTRYN